MRKSIYGLIGLIAAAWLAASPAAAPVDPLPGMNMDRIHAVIDTASGLRALAHIRHLAMHHRWFVSDGYDRAAGYIRDQAVKSGLERVVIHEFPSDGKRFYATEKSLPKWTVRSAELSLIAPVRKRLASWEEAPITLASNSRTADVTAALVDVGKGTRPSDYEGKDVAGKLVLASSPQNGGRIDRVHRLAVFERGAAGVIAYRGYSLDDHPDLITWDHINTLEQEGRPSTFGFCLSKRTGWELKRMRAEGMEVTLHAEVDADLGPGAFSVVDARIPGSDLSGQEIWFIAHLDHCLPSANDNASGSAAILETARTLVELYAGGVLPRPRRTLRFLWVPEIWGTYAFLAEKPEEAAKAVAVVNMDMAGEDQVLCGSTFRVTRTPDSIPSFFNDYLELNLDFLLSHEVDPNTVLADPLALISPQGRREPWRAAMIPYSGGSDHYVFMGGVINTPATMFGSWPDIFYHSSGDTPDKSDPTQLKRVVVLGALTGAGLAGMNPGSGLQLLDLMAAAGRIRLDETASAALAGLGGAPPDGRAGREALNRLQWAARRERLALRSLVSLLTDPEVAVRIKTLSGELDRHVQALETHIRDRFRALCRAAGRTARIPGPNAAEKAAAALIPLRNPAFPGPISGGYLAEKAAAADLSALPSLPGSAVYEIAAFMDGKLSVLDIRNAVSAECGPVELDAVLAYLRLLEKLDLVSFVQ